MKDFIKHYKIKCEVLKVDKRNRFRPRQHIKLKEDTTVYKKLCNGIVATLVIPKGTICLIPVYHFKYGSFYRRKCRTEFALVTKLTTIDGKHSFSEGLSKYNPSLSYNIHEFVFPKGKRYSKGFDECSSGIHFFFRKNDAKSW